VTWTAVGGTIHVMVPLRRNRDFLVLWSAQLVSTLGSQASLVAFPLLVLALTGSPAKAGIAAFANTIPGLLFLLPAGVLVDRHDRRRIMVAASAIGGVALGSIPLALALAVLAFGQIVAVAFVQGTVTAVFTLTEQGALPLVVDPRQVPEALARNEARREGANLAGPPLGGVLYGIGPALPFFADALSYLVCSLSVLAIRTPLQEPREPTPRRPLAEVAEGVRWLWRTTFVRASALAVAGANLIWGGVDLVLIVRAREHGASPAAIGVLFALFGVGGLVGALAAPAIARRVAVPVIVIGAFWVEAAAVAALATTHRPLVLGAIVALAVFPAPTWNATVVGARLTLTPDRLRGRVNSAARLLSGSMVPLGALAAGLLVTATGTTATLLVFSAWQALIAAAAMSARSLRHAQPAPAYA
jgi:predicted MFS family arabinose efflux permease